MKRQGGQSTVEMAIILPILLVLFLGIFDIGHILYIDEMLSNASREGARYGSLNTANSTDTQGIDDAVLADISGLNTNNLQISSSVVTEASGVNYVKVVVQYPVTIITPLFSEVIQNPFVDKAQTVMRVGYQ